MEISKKMECNHFGKDGNNSKVKTIGKDSGQSPESPITFDRFKFSRAFFSGLFIVINSSANPAVATI